MSNPEFFFRIRENGAAVFRVAQDDSHGRMELEEIAFANLKNGKVRAHGDHELTDEENEAIADWMQERAELLAQREFDDVLETIERINLAAHWAQSKATDEELDYITDQAVMAMFDLRGVLVRKKAERLRAAIAAKAKKTARET